MKIKNTSLSLLFFSIAISHYAQAGGSGPPLCNSPSYGSPISGNAPLHVEGQYIKDSDGRTVLLRGVNVSGNSKVPNFMPITSKSQLAPLPGWGINHLRLLFTWEAFETNRCNHDANYLAYYEQVVEWAEELGMYVIVDFHQDAYSRYSLGGCGEGFPKWAVVSSENKATPDNSAENCSDWGVSMVFDISTHNTWSAFHHDDELAQTDYLRMVEAVANRMASHSNVIGYELINEPWGWDDELYRLYEAVGAKIRARHPDAILFVPPHALVSGGTSSNNMTEQSFGNKVYSPHYYAGDVILNKSYDGSSDLTGPLNDRQSEADNWQVPMLLGEFGAPAETSNAASYMEMLYDWLDAHFTHASQWNYTVGWTETDKDGWNGEDLSIVDDQLNLRTQLFVPRPYPGKTAGTPVHFERFSNGFTFTWDNTPSTGATQLYIPDGYATGKTISTSAGSCAINGNTMSCTAPSTGNVTVTLQ